MTSKNKNTAAVLAALMASAIAVPAFAAGAVSPVPPKPVAVTAANTVVPSEAPVMTSPAAEPAPVPSASAGDTEDDPGAAEAIRVAKRHFGPTDKYEKVETYSSKQGNLSLYDITWSQGGNLPDMSATVGSDGVVYSWSLSKSISYGKIIEPSVTKLQAATKGIELIRKIYPDIAGDFSIENAYVSYSMSGYFTIEYRRLHDGYPVGEQYIYVNVDAKGEVYELGCEATYALTFPKADTKTDEELQSVIKDKLPMKLIYEKYYPDGYERDKKAQIRLVYVPNDDYRKYMIGAADGKLYTYTYDYGRGGGRFKNYAAEAAAPMPETASAAMADEQALSAAEQNSVDFYDSLITAEEAAKKVLADKSLMVPEKLPEKVKSLINYSYLRKNVSDFTDAEKYIWSLDMRYDEEDRWFSAQVNAETGDMISFGTYTNRWDKPDSYALGYDECLEIAGGFVRSRLPDIADEYELVSEKPKFDGDSRISSYSFSYTRVVNGIKYGSDSIYVDVEPDGGKIVSFSYSYSDAKFPSPAKAVTPEKAADAYFRAAETERRWVNVETGEKSGDADLVIASGNTVGKTVKAMLVTQAAYAKVEALRGKLITTPSDNGLKPAVYAFSDVEGHRYEKQIDRLANMGVIVFSEKYEPEKAIKEADLISMLNAAGSRYYYYSNSEEMRDKLTRMEAIKAIVSKLGWDEVASHGEIFRLDGFGVNTDEKDIGYIAISRALGLLDYADDNYDVSRVFTRGEAAALVSAYVDYLISKN